MYNEEGFLTDWQQWNRNIAQNIAAKENIILTAEHWLVIDTVREFYTQYHTTPPLRVIVKTLREHCGPTQGNSLYLQQLFPPAAAKMIAKIAGLPKPNKCI